MLDIWGFLLQTLTASGVAVLLLVIKALFRDKLPPKWHFAVWSVLGIVLLIPAGLNGRYGLFHWQFVVEVLKSWVGDYRITHVLFPIPFLNTLPRSIIDWIFAVYVLGVIAHMLKYTISYIQLRRVLRSGTQPCADTRTHIEVMAAVQQIQLFRIVEVPGLPSAFVCGICRPILALPADQDIDDKVLLHEFLHIRYKDTFWSVVICLLRCLHWCNPLLIYCANRAINDMEARCDQNVLEQLEGEARRDYGHILLSMVNERFAKTPCSTCVNNGGKNIRERIEAIARFKKYPVGMRLVSVCAIIFLVFSLVVGVQATEVYNIGNSISMSLASARSIPCTTPAGALDTYGKAVLTQRVTYFAMCAPEDLQEQLAATHTGENYMRWNAAFPDPPDPQSGYYIYNLKRCGKTAYEALLVVELSVLSPEERRHTDRMYLAVQNLRVEKEKGRWIVIPLDDLSPIETRVSNLDWGCDELPSLLYVGRADDFQVAVHFQTIYMVDNTVQAADAVFSFFSHTSFDTAPKPNARFDTARCSWDTSCTHLGTQAERDKIKQIGLSVAPVYAGGERPELPSAAMIGNMSGNSNNGMCWASQAKEPGWGPTITLGGGGTDFNPNKDIRLPEYYTADLYTHQKLYAQMDLYLQEEAAK